MCARLACMNATDRKKSPRSAFLFEIEGIELLVLSHIFQPPPPGKEVTANPLSYQRARVQDRSMVEILARTHNHMRSEVMMPQADF